MITLIIVGVVCLAVGFAVGCVYSNQQPYDSGFYEHDDFEDE